MPSSFIAITANSNADTKTRVETSASLAEVVHAIWHSTPSTITNLGDPTALGSAERKAGNRILVETEQAVATHASLASGLC